jgi:hypothetical protein
MKMRSFKNLNLILEELYKVQHTTTCKANAANWLYESGYK